jgi:hypothetical protein
MAIEDSLKASGRRVLPALQAGCRGSDSQEMVGAVGAAARGAWEAGERGGGQPQADSAGGQGVEGGMGVVWDHAGFHKGKTVEAVPRRLEAEEEGLIAGRVALYPSSFECPAFMTKKLCL